MPKEDPIQLFGLTFNDEILFNYERSHSFLRNVVKIEKTWKVDKL